MGERRSSSTAACRMRRWRLSWGVWFVAAIVAWGAARAAWDWVRWWRHAPERATLDRLWDRLLDTGVAVVRGQERLDSAEQALQRYDARLRAWGWFEPAGIVAYNRLVRERNAVAARVNALRQERQRLLLRYQTVQDSVQAVAARLGEPWFPVPLPAEAAARRGVIDTLRGTP